MKAPTKKFVIFLFLIVVFLSSGYLFLNQTKQYVSPGDFSSAASHPDQVYQYLVRQGFIRESDGQVLKRAWMLKDEHDLAFPGASFVNQEAVISVLQPSVKKRYGAFLKRIPLVPSAILFIALYVGVTAFIWLGPKDLFRIIAAAIYGPFLSTLLVYIGEMGNVLVFFSMSRHFGRGFVEQRLSGRMQRIDNAIAETSFWSIFFLRFFIVVPFRFQDLGFGLTKISLKKYFLICLIGSPLRIFVIQFLLSLGLSTVLNPQRFSAYLDRNPLVFVLCLLYAIGSFVLIYVLKKRATRRRGREEI